MLIARIRCAGYIGEFEFVDNHRSGKIVVELNGRYDLSRFGNTERVGQCAGKHGHLHAVAEIIGRTAPTGTLICK